MKTNSRFASLCTASIALLLAATWIISFDHVLAAQQYASNSVDAQREAMRKLSFLVGHWAGPVTIARGPGKPVQLTQTENVEYKLDGLVLLIEGKSTNAEDQVLFSALATIAYDGDSHTYRLRAYNDGHYLDAELSVPGKGFSWSFAAGPAHILNTMRLTEKGEWNEVTEATVGSSLPHRNVEMLLQHLR